ncbi:MAG: 30S ribosomal protein S18 [Terriglobia bacterium]
MEQQQPPRTGGAPPGPAGPGTSRGRSEGRGSREARGRGPGRGREGGRRFYRRRKVCKFCTERVDHVDYKDVKLLVQFVTERGKIMPRRVTGTCFPHQRQLKVAIKRARNIALLPFQAAL